MTARMMAWMAVSRLEDPQAARAAVTEWGEAGCCTQRNSWDGATVLC